MHENQTSKESHFFTLTYDQEHVPENHGLNKKHLQDYFKRLRKKNTGTRIRFFGCGEYGEHGSRPHYHAIIFGLEINDLRVYKTDSKGFGKNRKEYKTYTSDINTKIWGKGMVVIGTVNRTVTNYVSGYMLKEQYLHAKGNYEYIDPETGAIHQRIPPYITMSTKPGIGYDWLEKFKNDAFPHDYVVIEGNKQPVPSYYFRKLEQENPQLAEQIKSNRVKAIKTETFQANNTPERLKTREEFKQLETKFFKKKGAI